MGTTGAVDDRTIGIRSFAMATAGMLAVCLLFSALAFGEEAEAVPGPRAESTAPPDPKGTDEAQHRRDKPIGEFTDNFYGHEPLYILYGSESPDVKFQISFRYRFVSTRGSLARKWWWVSNLFFGYTQTTFGDLKSDSMPFDDNNFKPEFFYLDEEINQGFMSRGSRFGFQSGLEHISNGRSGVTSRSLNIFYIKPIFDFAPLERYHFTIAPKIWAYLEENENPDIEKYWGYFDLLVQYGKSDGFQLSSNLRKGTADGKGSIQVDLSYPLNKLLFGNLDMYLQAQYFNGYGESLTFYNEKSSHVRFGIAFYR